MTLAEYQQLVRGGQFRGKFRMSFEKPEPFVPGRVEAVNFTMPDVNHVFRRGQRVMVQVAVIKSYGSLPKIEAISVGVHYAR